MTDKLPEDQAEKSNDQLTLEEAKKLEQLLALDRGIPTEQLTHEFQEALQKILEARIPIAFSGFMHSALGDNIIDLSGLFEVFEVFCRKKNIPLPQFTIHSDDGFNFADASWILRRDLEPSQTYTNTRLHFVSIYLPLLGISENDLRLDLPPKLVNLDGHTPFSQLNEETLLREAAKIRQEKGRFILICQAGSMDVKRFSDNQIQKIKAILEQKHIPYEVLSDENMQDFSLLASNTLAAERIITTDTSWAWCAGAAHRTCFGDKEVVSRFENKMVVLHTVTTNFWHVPLSHSVYGKIIQRKVLIHANGQMFREDYYSLNRDAVKKIGISDQDFDYFLEELKKYLDEVNPWPASVETSIAHLSAQKSEASH